MSPPIGLGLGLGLSFGQPSGSTPFVPTDDADLKAWYRMDLGATTGGGGTTLTALADQSGTGDAAKNLTNTGTVGYTASAAAYNNRPVATFAAASRLQGSGVWAAALTQPLTVYWVGEMTGGRIFDGVAGGRCAAIYSGGNVLAYAGASFVTAAGSTPANPHVGCIVFNGASTANYFNDFATAAGTGSAGTDGLLQLVLGALGGGGGELTGKIAEVIAYAGADDAAKRAQVRSYFTTIYAL